MSTIRIRRSAVPGKIPTTEQLDLGEFALNTTDGKIYLKKSSGGVESIVTVGEMDANTILQLLKTVDGENSGLDSDLWQGNVFDDWLDQPVRTIDNVTFANITGKTITGEEFYVGETLVIDSDGNWVGGGRGYTGSRGDTGYTGSQGYSGSQGPIGYTGSKGDVGFTGSQGEQGGQGEIGFTGSKGDTGSQGEIGFTGSQGEQGELGLTGSHGFTGSIGYTGSEGAGFTGSKGDLGYTGSKGEYEGPDPVAMSLIFGGGEPSENGIDIEVDETTNVNTFYPILSDNQSNGSLDIGKVSPNKFYFNASTGEVSAVDFITLSDISLKTNVIPIENVFTILEQINTYSFEWKDSGNKAYGVLAHELETILPELVRSKNDLKSVSYLSLIAILIDAVKELKTEMDELKENNQ